ncbi:hypothetical protein FAI41_05095 [Acetobacteraceae bacterium]|nr:hypothetical protein FAI41_05035 [Acetobacteraceae bacterium]QCE33019.1 hypothetical protein FAI41_05095 [Acetobacteraceae bacterium]
MKKQASQTPKRSLYAYRLFLISFPLVMSGCYHRGPLDVVTDFIHNMRGGTGSGLLPPAPGTHGAYPFVGDVPKENPEFPTRQAQLAMTEKLEADRNWAQRHAAVTGDLKWPKLAPPPPLSDLAGNMVMVDNAKTQTPPPQKELEEPLPEDLAPQPEKDGSDLIDHHGLPKVIYHPNSHADIPVSRLPVVEKVPKDQHYPGFDIPKGGKDIQPDINFSEPEGILIHFKPLTDEIGNKEIGHLQDAMQKARATKSRYIITGFGNALAADASLDPEDQAREVAFGLLRAQAVGNHLIQMGVNPRDISLKGEPIGDSARITLEPKKPERYLKQGAVKGH